MFGVQNLRKKQESSLQLELESSLRRARIVFSIRFQVKCLNFKTVTYFHSNPVINALVLSDVLSDVRVTYPGFLFSLFLFLKFRVT